jgi:transposase
MLQITPQMRILVAVEAVDFRKGIDSLAELCRAKLQADPFSGGLFVFRSRRATSIKFWSTMGKDFGWRPSVYPRGAFAGGRRGRSRRRCSVCIKRRCCWPQATRTLMPVRCGAK